jgi:branched-chain amino acid transport system substrate-binding protein
MDVPVIKPRKSVAPGLLLFALVFVACDKSPILIGVPVGLTGLTSRLGVKGRNGIQLAADEINAAGGVRGRPLHLLVENDGDDADQALETDKRLVEAGVVALVGHLTTKSGSKAIPWLNERQVVLISPTISSIDFSGKDDFFFRVIGANDQQGEALARKALASGFSKVATVYEESNQGYTKSVIEGFRRTFALGGGRSLGTESFTTNAHFDYIQLVDRLLSHKPELVVAACSSFDAANICQELSKRGNDLPVYISMWAHTDDLFVFGGKTVERVIAVGGSDPRVPGAATQKFRQTYLARFGEEPDFSGIYGYEALKVLASALEKARTLDGPGIKNALLAIKDFPGMQTPISFDGFGDCSRPYSIYTVEDGAFVLED